MTDATTACATESAAEDAIPEGRSAAVDRPQPPEVVWLTSEQQAIWRTYLDGTARLTRALEAALRPFGLDLPEYEILVRLSEAPGRRMRMSDLAEAARQSRSRLTHTISRLGQRGIVGRDRSCRSDRRGVWAELTDEGFALLQQVAPFHVASVQSNLVEPLSASDYQTLGRIFASVARDLTS